MCGIAGIISDQQYPKLKYYLLSDNFLRGPDKITDYEDYNRGIFMQFYRLAVRGISTGDQPFIFEEGDRKIVLFANAEIYNYKQLCRSENVESIASDCEIILNLYLKYGDLSFVRKLNSEHAFVILDTYKEETRVLFSNDTYGKRPLFILHADKSIYYSSTLKTMNDLKKNVGGNVIRMTPGTNRVYTFRDNRYKCETETYFDINKYRYDNLHTVQREENVETQGLKNTIRSEEETFKHIRYLFEESVRLRLDSDVPIGALLSGGFDSSLVCAIASKYIQNLRTFSIGIEGIESLDEPYAYDVSKHINSNHTHITVSQNDIIECLSELISILGTFDITTIRASTLQYLLCKWIKNNTDIRVLLVGDGSDELFGSYAYLENAPSKKEFHDECIRLLKDIHYFDGLRADRTVSACGLECRIPFLDKDFVKFIVKNGINSDYFGIASIEKFVIRMAFANENILPDNVMWRKKLAMSNSAGGNNEKSLVNLLKDFAEMKINTIDDNIGKEAKLYYILFTRYYPSLNGFDMDYVMPYYWMPKFVSNDIKDPSATFLSNYSESVHSSKK